MAEKLGRRVATFARPHRTPPPVTDDVLKEQLRREVKAASVAFGDSGRLRRLSRVFRLRPDMRSGFWTLRAAI